jgi:hypothetical protein
MFGVFVISSCVLSRHVFSFEFIYLPTHRRLSLQIMKHFSVFISMNLCVCEYTVYALTCKR